MIATWLDASRWTYNLTVEVLQSGIPAAWRHIAGMVMAELKVLKPEWESVPYQVKRTAVRDACRAMSNVKTFNRQLAADRAIGERPDEDFAQSGDGVVALDPGVRTFLTYFSETDCGKLGHHAFGRIQRLCHWLDDLISRTAKAPNRRKRRQMRSAQARCNAPRGEGAGWRPSGRR